MYEDRSSKDSIEQSIEVEPPNSEQATEKLSQRHGPTVDFGSEALQQELFQQNSLRQAGEMIGRYRIIRDLGSGGFGQVYLADDSDLQRKVSIKIPHPHCIRSESDLAKYMEEARTVAQLDHPGIVPVYDIGRIPDRLCYIVSKYIEGTTLSQLTRSKNLTVTSAISIISTLADTLQYVHEQGVVHRDIKPSNVLRDIQANLFINDFGLALNEPKVNERGKIIGTPGYMSPEQASGEGHLVDGRSDIFSLGVMLYEMLTGKQPFRGGDADEVLNRIRYLDPKPIRQINHNLPKELERVCQKSLAKKTSERYSTARDFATDLRSCLERSGSAPMVHFSAVDSNSGRATASSERIIVIPKGLRSYEAHDATFFRSMLPGPYDIDGCPESIRFWRSRIDPSGQSDPFRVGVIYGTSGCGKSSFVRAGLVPMLGDQVTVCMVDATASGTLANLAKSLQRQVPELNLIGMRLDEQFATIRRTANWRQGRKLLIVIDQFEQWLNAAQPGGIGQSDEIAQREVLIRALRQCDGDRLQTILLVRDDFWLAVSRLMSELDIEMVPNRNLSMIDLLDKPHAEKVLRMLGHAFGRVHSEGRKIPRDQRAFITEAVDLLAENDRVVAVRLALFAEIMKARAWTRSTLRDLGGIQGTVERFLYESFDADSAPKEHRIHRRAAHAVLQSLLPESGLIRGPAVDRQQLLVASGYGDAPTSFSQLLRILDTDLRLITPIESTDDSINSTIRSETNAQGFIQLTHDSLVPAIRSWVSSQQRLTLAGRAKLSLTARAMAWTADPQTRQLPSFFEWFRFALLTRRNHQSLMQQQMMRVATKRYSRFSLAYVACLFVASMAIYQYRNWANVENLVGRLKTATTANLPAIFEAIEQNRSWADGSLRAIRDDAAESDRARFLASLCIPTSSPQSIEFLHRYLADADLDTLALAARHPSANWKHLDDRWEADLADDSLSSSVRFHAALMLGHDVLAGKVKNASDDTKAIWFQHANLIAHAIVAETLSNRLQYGELIQLIEPLRDCIRLPLSELANQPDNSSQRETTVTLLRDIFADNPALLCEVFIDLPTVDLISVLPALKPHSEQISAMLRWASESSGKTATASSTSSLLNHARKRAHTAALLANLSGDNDGLWKILSENLEDESDVAVDSSTSELTTAATLIEILTLFQPSFSTLLEQFEESDNRTLRRHLLFAIGECASQPQAPELIIRAKSIARKAFENDPHADIHSAAHWLLVNLGDHEWLRTTHKRMADRAKDARNKPHQQEWSVTPEGITLVRIDARHDPKIGITFELATTELSLEHFRQFDQDNNRILELGDRDDQSPAGLVTWFDAVKYCRWLSAREGLSEDQMCYPASTLDGDMLGLVSDYRNRSGYRLPTKEEWDFAWNSDPVRVACMSDPLLVNDYGYFSKMVGEGKAQPIGNVKPDCNGLFHLAGNAYEWCSDRGGNNYLSRGLSIQHNTADVNKITSDVWFTPTINWRSVGLRLFRSVVEK